METKDFELYIYYANVISDDDVMTIYEIYQDQKDRVVGYKRIDKPTKNQRQSANLYEVVEIEDLILGMDNNNNKSGSRL